MVVGCRPQPSSDAIALRHYPRPQKARGFDTPPLHALATSAAGGNGVYGYGTADTFPANTYQALNYWGDVVFSTSASSPTRSAPGRPCVSCSPSLRYGHTGTRPVV